MISPLIANVYLDAFDQFMKGRGHCIVRRLRAVRLKLWKKPVRVRLHRRLRQLGYTGQFKYIKMNSWDNAASLLSHYTLPNSYLHGQMGFLILVL